MDSKEVQLKANAYTSIVKHHDKPIVAIGAKNGRYVHTDYASHTEAINSYRSEKILQGCVVYFYDLNRQDYVVGYGYDVKPHFTEIPYISPIIAYYLNK